MMEAACPQDSASFLGVPCRFPGCYHWAVLNPSSSDPKKIPQRVCRFSGEWFPAPWVPMEGQNRPGQAKQPRMLHFCWSSVVNLHSKELLETGGKKSTAGHDRKNARLPSAAIPASMRLTISTKRQKGERSCFCCGMKTSPLGSWNLKWELFGKAALQFQGNFGIH